MPIISDTMIVKLLILGGFTFTMNLTLAASSQESIDENYNSADVTKCTSFTSGEDNLKNYLTAESAGQTVDFPFIYHCPPKLLDALAKNRIDKDMGSSCCYGITRKPYCCSSSTLNSVLWIVFVLLLLGLLVGGAYFAYQKRDSISNLWR